MSLPAEKRWIALLFLIALCFSGYGQKSGSPSARLLSANHVLGENPAFIQQAGQYLQDSPFSHLGTVQAGFEGFSAPVLFTSKGLVFLQRKEIPYAEDESERMAQNGVPEEEIERRKVVTHKAVTMEWLDCNPSPQVELLEQMPGYHTYGKMPNKAYRYSVLKYRNLYPGIDLVYFINPLASQGFEYSLVLHPGADLALVKMKYGGDVAKIRIDPSGTLVIKTAIDEIFQSGLKSFNTLDSGQWKHNGQASLLDTRFEVQGSTIGFRIPGDYDKNKILVIDPFITSSGTLTGSAAGKAKDVDFDYAGNVYVTGGGDGNVHQMAKYDVNGVLQWTFSGTVNNPQWNFGPYFGGWVVEKTTGNIYLGQGFDFLTGFIVVRISTTGLYDNYMTTGNPNFRENWKMIWNCNNGIPQILVAGGGTNSNINLGVLTPPAVVPGASNITGIADIAFQDMSDMVIDPLTNSMYTIYASGSVPALNNAIYKHNQPYSAATKVWNVASGYPVLNEAANRAYMGTGYSENSTNMLAVNPNFLFYWDGRNLKAFDKATGAVVGAPLATGNTALMQGGIIADACDNVFAGDVNGTIKVYHFNGANFDDAAAPDIAIAGFATKSVYDLAYNETLKILYASGDGFVTAIDVATYCPNTVYALTLTTNCITASVSAGLNPLPPTGSSVTYQLFSGTTLVATNTSGLFSGLNASTTYHVIATINQACSGTQATGSFLMPGPTVGIVKTDAICGVNSGVITATGSGTSGPYTYSSDGVTFQPAGNFNALAGGIYTITVKDANGCNSAATVTILNTNGPSLSFTQVNAECGSSNASVTATAINGTAPYQFSFNGGLTWQISNFFTALLAGKYTLSVKDAGGCINSSVVTITSSPMPLINAIPSAATCGNNNGLINVFGTSGTAPYGYSVDGNNFQATNSFVNLTPGPYTVTIKDANGCRQTVAVNISNTPAPTVTAVASQSACANMNGSVTATGSGGLPPYQYRINNGFYQDANLFSGLLGATYAVSVRDMAGCVGTTSVTVSSLSSGPAVTATTTASACNVNNGSIVANATGGLPPYQFSLNNSTFQAATTFPGLAPGNYVVYAKDAAGCIHTVSVTVSPASGPSLTVAVSASSCLVDDGSIVVTATGGFGTLSYSIDGVNFVAGNSFTGLAPGIYTATVKDDNGCSRFKTVTVLNAAGLLLSTAALSTSCSGNSGSITAIASGGAFPLEYSIDGINYQPSNIFSSLTAGSYVVYVRDANACVITKSATVNAIAGPVLTLSKTDATCGSASGAIQASAFGGIAPLTYSINSGAFTPMNAFINLAPGTYTVVVKDAGNCTATQSVTITNSGSGEIPTNVTFTLRNALPCTGGVVKIKNLRGLPSGGGRKYEFSLDFGAFVNDNQFVGVLPGNHVITAVNEDGCTVSRIATIGTGIPASANYTAVGTPCGTTNGSITISGVGGSTPYHASFDNGVTWNTFFPPGANSRTYSNLAPGTYPIIMADDADFTAGTPDDPGACLTTIFATVPTIGGPVVNAIKFDGTCALNDGSITASGTGIAPLSYSLNGGAYQASGFFGGLASGTYTISLKDGNNCTSSTSVSINNPTGPIVSAAVISASCNEHNGSISASSTNGVNPVQYSLDGFVFQPGNIFSGLEPGLYQLYAKDANGCYNSIFVNVPAMPLPRVTAFSIAASCGNSDGTVFCTAASAYQYSLDGVIFQSNPNFTGLPAGLHTVTLKDDRGCTTSTAITLSNIGAPTFTNTAATATCGNANGSTTITASGGQAPYTYSSDNINYQPGNTLSALSGGSTVLSVKDNNGCLSSKLVLVAGAAGPHTLTAVVTPASCGLGNGVISAAGAGGVAPLQFSRDGINYQFGGFFSGVTAGSYTVWVKDANSCTKTILVDVPQLNGPLVTAALPSAATCITPDGTITALAGGGTGSLTYSLNAAPFQASNIFTGVAAGTYNITAKDAKGCTSVFSNVIVPAVSNMVFGETHTNPSCAANDGTITLTGSLGTAPYEYSLDGVLFQLSNTFSGLSAGSYPVVIKDAAGCSSGALVTIVSPASNPKTWLGINTNWQDAANWCGGVPLITENVLVPSGLSNYPVIANGTGYAKNLIIEAGASLLVTAAMQVADSIQNAGLLNIVQGKIEFNGTGKQAVAGSMFYQHTLHELVISNTSIEGVVVSGLPGDTLKISRKLSFGYDQAVFTTGDNVTLLSADTATASLGVIRENPDGSPMATINGQLIVERYYPRKRAWRLITAPFINDAAAPTINAAWQEGANPPSITNSTNPDPHPGYGTHITGPFAGPSPYTPLVTASGFDQSPQNNSSMKYYDGLTNSYRPVLNTLTEKVTNRQGYLLFVRGNRSYSIGSTSNLMSPDPTILRARGNPATGMKLIPADTGLQVIGNPYPSAIRFDDSMFTHNAAILKNQSFWLWDPLRGAARNSPTNVGGWIPIVYTGSGTYISTYNPSQSVAGLDSAHDFTIDGSIQSGAAFMIDNKATASGSFTIHESSKIDGSNNNLFRPMGTVIPQLSMNLFRTNAANTPLYWADGSVLLFDNGFTDEPNGNEDIRKVFSAGENVYLQHGDHVLAIEKRGTVLPVDTIWLGVKGLKTGNYRFELFFTNWLASGSEAIFEDMFTGVQTVLSTVQHSLVDIVVTNEPASLATNRFRIIFKPLHVLPVSLVDVSAWEQGSEVKIEWTAQQQQSVAHYVVEESLDGRHFETLLTMPVNAASGDRFTYHATDPSPRKGYNFYRIRVLEQNGHYWFSEVVKVDIGAGLSYMVVAPNPIRGIQIPLLMHQVRDGRFPYTLYNASGQELMSGNLLHSGGSQRYLLQPKTKLLPGIYRLVIATDAKTIALQVAVVAD